MARAPEKSVQQRTLPTFGRPESAPQGLTGSPSVLQNAAENRSDSARRGCHQTFLGEQRYILLRKVNMSFNEGERSANCHGTYE
jgi:hypothetical protein